MTSIINFPNCNSFGANNGQKIKLCKPSDIIERVLNFPKCNSFGANNGHKRKFHKTLDTTERVNNYIESTHVFSECTKKSSAIL